MPDGPKDDSIMLHSSNGTVRFLAWVGGHVKIER